MSKYPMVDAQEHRKMEAAKSTLVRNAPFYGVLLMSRLTMVQDPSCPTAWTDGRWIGYNPEWTKELRHLEKVFLLAHEVDHVARKHHLRLKGRDARKWNVAGDMIINWWLDHAGFEMISGGLMADDHQRSLSTEALYAKLPDQQGGGGGGGKGQGGNGSKNEPSQDKDSRPANDGHTGLDEVRMPTDEGGRELTPSEVDALERELEIDIWQATMTAKKAGKCPAYADRLVEEMKPADADWREQLREFASEIGKNDSTWVPPNKRYVYQGLYLPSLRSNEIGEGWLFIDTSGSIGRAVLQEFAEHVARMVEDFNVNLNILYIDAAVQGEVQVIEPGQEIVLEARGGGGTDFRPGFEWLKEQGIVPKWLVYFTDMCGTFPEGDLGFPVLWCQYGDWDHYEEPDHGRVVRINDI